MAEKRYGSGFDRNEISSSEKRNEVLERELRTYKGLMRGHRDYLNGDVMGADKADKKIRRAKGWVSVNCNED
ncbi:hypothetical protein [Eggerthella sp. YY7918]|uniref:hypothetical protein n=1 Tax=Eggerthella sp. (strain YY7918) TaxID=502558 RepID=UPI0002171889|nr:hypothetical protein [Eggerthella sp. YY7918]BAK44049.1 hypothetical protein EGYY_08560 [Eggerthella sp. YY7918]